MSELLESRWQDTKTALPEGPEGNKKAPMGVTQKILKSIWQRSLQRVHPR